MIDKLANDSFFLSNYYELPFEYNGLSYRNAEAAFHAQKVMLDEDRVKFTNLRADQANRLGGRVPLRSDWEEVKDDIMLDILRSKFNCHTMKKKLLETGDQEIVYHNRQGDQYWGVCGGEGENRLGEILMKIRSEII